MRTPSIRTLAALSYERGEEFDPALALTPGLLEALELSAQARWPLEAESEYERRRKRRRGRRTNGASAPVWLTAEDLVSGSVRLVHGEPV
jgi:hypothetical protein